MYNFEKHKADKQVYQLDRIEVQFSFCFSILAANKINYSEHMEVLVKYPGLNVSGLESMSEIYMLKVHFFCNMPLVPIMALHSQRCDGGLPK